jgi:hypothetical protein
LLEKASYEFHVAIGPKEKRTNSRYLTFGLFQSWTGIPGFKNSIAAVTTGGAPQRNLTNLPRNS